MLGDKTLTISPIEKHQIQPASVDIRLGNTFRLQKFLWIWICNEKGEQGQPNLSAALLSFF